MISSDLFPNPMDPMETFDLDLPETFSKLSIVEEPHPLSSDYECMFDNDKPVFPEYMFEEELSTQEEPQGTCRVCKTTHRASRPTLTASSKKGRSCKKQGLCNESIRAEIKNRMILRLCRIEKTYKASINRSDAARTALVRLVKKLLNELAKFYSSRTTKFEKFYSNCETFHKQITGLLLESNCLAASDIQCERYAEFSFYCLYLQSPNEAKHKKIAQHLDIPLVTAKKLWKKEVGPSPSLDFYQ